MKRFLTIVLCMAAMVVASLSAKAQEVTITLFPGWNWISYPNAEVMDINTALGDFVPMNGDIIHSQYGSSAYVNGYWRGGVTHFMPGWGYMYYSNRTEVVSFVFGETAPQLTVTTAEPTDITATSAMSGGSITSNDGSYIYVFMKGICWATHPNPMVMNDFFTENGSGAESFTAEMIDLSPNTVYYVRAYAVTLDGTFYGDELNFTTLDEGSNGHEYVDLGLPSGTLWATCNIGANVPEEYGDYFAWGETQPKDTYSWDNYQFCIGDGLIELTKYCSISNYGYNEFTDDLTILQSEDDAAIANWGSEWRMPTKEEWQELLDNTSHTRTTLNGVTGSLFVASNGNSLFLPAADGRYILHIYNPGDHCCYWSSSLDESFPLYSWGFYSSSDYSGVNYNVYRSYGQSVRAVRSLTHNNVPIGAINGKFTINEEGIQVYFSQGNLQYTMSTQTWSFMEHQYDMVENGQSVGPDYANQDVISLFGWGTSGYNHGAICYQPWNTGANSANYYAYGNLEYNLYEQSGKADWGYNPISNGGNQAGMWRTLTNDEWRYVLNTRSTMSGVLYAKACVNGVNGVILLPDNWNSTTYVLNYPNRKDAPFTANEITLSSWEIIEANGAIFLPASGYRFANLVYDVGSCGDYWSSTSTLYDNGSGAYYSFFSNSDLAPSSYLCVRQRYNGLSVRLVCNAL